jgi:CO/xanthine dehydrogenase FAD-binding subunit
MKHPEITTPKSLDEALKWLHQFSPMGGVVLAGGTDLFIEWRSGIPKPPYILNIACLDILSGIEVRQDELWFGPMTSMAAIAKSTTVTEKAPCLARAAGVMGSPLIRERATIGGNLCHASPAADTAAPLLVLDAKVELRSVDKTRHVPLQDFFTGPGETVMKKDELLIGITVPIVEGRRDFYLRLGQRQAMACAKISVAGSAILNNQHFQQIKIALGAAAPVPLLAKNTMAVLEDAKPTKDAMEKAARLAMDECDPIDDIRSTIEYRRDMVRVLLRTGLKSLLSSSK